jgi:outer membrane protein assembly factor BamB
MPSAGGVPPQSAPARSWPGLWGPSRNGIAPAWGTTVRALKELWRRPSAGGYSEIAIAGDRAVTLELRNGEDFVVAFDASSGRELWSTRIGPTYRGHGGSDDGPIATPAIDGADVFAAGPHGHLLALDLATGKERWRHDLVKEFGATIPRWGFGSSPLVEANLIVVPTGGENSRGLLAFDRDTGRLAWSAPHAKATAYSSAVPTVIAGTRQILTAAGDRVFAVSPGDGQLLWSTPGPGNDTEVANSPVVLPDDRVLLTYWQDALMLKVSKQGGELVATELWRSTTPRGSNGPTVHRDGFLFGFAGPQLVCQEAATGDVRWRERTGEGTLIGVGADLLFLSQTSGDLRVVRAAPDRFIELSRTSVFKPDVRSVTGPSIADRRVFVRNIRELAAFSVAREP